MKNLNKIITWCVVVAMIIPLVACADKEAEVDQNSLSLEWEEVTTKQQDEEFVEIVVPEKITDTEKEYTEDAGSVPVNDNTEETALINDNAKETTNTASEEANIASSKPIETSAASQQTQDVSVPSTTIVGTIKSLGDCSFSISRADVNSNIMVSTDEIVNVVYSGSTEFEVCTSSDGGITTNYAAGTSSDLQAGRLVNIVGAYEGSDFVAQKITIKIFG